MSSYDLNCNSSPVGQNFAIVSILDPPDDLMKMRILHDFKLFMNMYGKKFLENNIDFEMDKLNEAFTAFRTSWETSLIDLWKKKVGNKTSTRLFMVHGCYNSGDEATKAAHEISLKHSLPSILVCQLGHYMPFTTNPEKVKEIKCMNNEKINKLFKAHKETELKIENEVKKNMAILERELSEKGVKTNSIDYSPDYFEFKKQIENLDKESFEKENKHIKLLKEIEAGENRTNGKLTDNKFKKLDDLQKQYKHKNDIKYVKQVLTEGLNENQIDNIKIEEKHIKMINDIIKKLDKNKMCVKQINNFINNFTNLLEGNKILNSLQEIVKEYS